MPPGVAVGWVQRLFLGEETLSSSLACLWGGLPVSSWAHDSDPDFVRRMGGVGIYAVDNLLERRVLSRRRHVRAGSRDV